jgi:hypothetical protein
VGEPNSTTVKRLVLLFYFCFCVFVDVELTGLSVTENNYTSGLALYNITVEEHACLNIPVNEAV